MSFPWLEFPCWSSKDDLVQFSSVEYGRLLAMLPGDEESDGPVFKQHGHGGKVVWYVTPVLPLTAPHTVTPYEEPLSEEHSPPLGMKYQVSAQLQHWMTTHRLDYAPLPHLSDCIQESLASKQRDLNYDLFLGTCLTVLPVSMATDSHLVGCLCHPTGADFSTLAVSLMSSSSRGSGAPPATFAEWSSHHAPLSLMALEGHTLPTRIRQVDSSCVRGKVHVCARCDYHIAVFELCSSVAVDRLAAGHPPPTTAVLSCVALTAADSLVEHISLSPFIGGEYVAVSERGGVYLREPGAKATTLRWPSHRHTSPVQRQCCYGNHPRSILLVENFRLFSLDLRSPSADLRPLMDPSHKITCISRDPAQDSFCVFLSTVTHVLLVDLRQSECPLLAVRHELPYPPRFLSPLSPSGGPSCVVLVSTSEGSRSVVFNYTGSPPRFSAAPHSVAAITEVPLSLNGATFAAPLSQVSYRLKQHLVGSALLAVDTEQFAAIVMTTIGDVFYQTWSYSPQNSSPPNTTLSLTHGYELWVREALAQQQELREFRDVYREPKKNVNPFVNYLLASPAGICFKCFSNNIATPPAGESATPPAGDDAVGCSVCLKELPQAIGSYDGMAALKEVCHFQPPKTDLEVALVTGWPEEA